MSSGNTTAPPFSASPPRVGVKLRGIVEGGIHAILFCCASISVFTTISIVVVLVWEAAQFFRDVSIVDFLTDTQWTPLLKPQHYGILPLFCGTMLVAMGAAMIAIPLGLGTAIYLSEYAGPRFRGIVKPVLEVLGGIPSVVYGFFAVVFVSPIIRSLFESAGVFNAANACVVVGVMILPMIISLSEDSLRSVPNSLREGAYALGATKYDVTVQVVVPGGAFGDRRFVPAGHLASHWRDDGGHPGRRRDAQFYIESAG